MDDTMKTAHNVLKAALADAMDERHERQEVVRRYGSEEIEWVFHEREVMLSAVNKMRLTQGLKPVKMDDVVRAEHQASGHSDYFHQFSWFCAELAVDRVR